jgi:acetyl esterase/lipase
MDYLETDKDIDATRIGVVGHSRGGKAALWCGAEDERFALVISNDSGSTGAALARNKKGESIARINDSFPHWFCENYKKYNDKEEELPIDQHQLIALIAPRLGYVASASQDEWADPKNEFMSCFHASPVWKLWEKPGVTVSEQPPVNKPAHDGYVGYHLREGKHNLGLSDWNWYMDFADKHLRKP